MSTSSGVPKPELAAGEVEHLVDVIEDRVDVVRDEQHRRAVVAAPAIQQRGHLLLMAQIKGGERLVAEQYRRIGRER